MAHPTFSLARLSAALFDRTAGRVRTTDWWAVIVELVVVVVGIIIAFELNEWDQRRQARKEEAAVLRHLSEEATADMAAIGAIANAHRQSARNYIRLLTARDQPRAAHAYPRTGDSACNLLRMPAVRYHSPTGLEANDRTEIIEDGELRHLIRRANAERAFNDRQLDYFRDAFNRYALTIEPHTSWRLSGSGAFECTVDVVGITSDRVAFELLPKAARDQLRFAEYRQRELRAVQAVAERAQCLRLLNCDH